MSNFFLGTLIDQEKETRDKIFLFTSYFNLLNTSLRYSMGKYTRGNNYLSNTNFYTCLIMDGENLSLLLKTLQLKGEQLVVFP